MKSLPNQFRVYYSICELTVNTVLVIENDRNGNLYGRLVMMRHID